MGVLTLEDLPQYTHDDYKTWQGDWELIYGIPYAMAPAPVNKHQIINTKIARALDEALDDCPQCTALIEADWKLSDDTVFRPDATVICYEPEAYLTKAPEIVFEVISPATAKRDETLKFQAYEAEGVKYYCIVYPDMLIAKVYELKEGRYLKAGDFDTETFTFGFKNCKIHFDFSKIFARFRK